MKRRMIVTQIQKWMLEGGLKAPPPCTLSAYRACDSELLNQVGLRIPSEVADFYMEMNGCRLDEMHLLTISDPTSSIEELKVPTASMDFLQANLSYRRANYPAGWLLLGRSDFGHLIYDYQDNQYHRVDERAREILDSFETWEELIADTLQVIEGLDDHLEEPD